MKRYGDAHLASILRAQGKPVDFPVRPEPRHRSNDESREQQNLIVWWAHACAEFGIPEFLLFSVPNGGRRSPITGSIMKREGARRGAPDLMLAVKRGKYAGLFCEMKHETGTLRTEQRAFLDELSRQGYAASACYGFQDAKRFIEAYLRGDEFF